jgi:ligand-binding sensor domain-containing protein/DNA-binding CsgD family transcriptional regulator
VKTFYENSLKKRFFHITLMLVLITVTGPAGLSEIKDFGTPFIRNFTRHDYKAGTQNWDIAQDLKGFMYFANNEGLLVYDGVQWDLYKMPNLSMVRSIFIDPRGEIYIGAYNELGKMVPGAGGKLTYLSLKDKIPSEYQNFDDVWSISAYKGKIVFQSYNAIYIYEEGKPISVVPAPSRIPTSFNESGRLFFNDAESGLLEFDGSRMAKLDGCEKLKGIIISSILPFRGENEILICTADRGLFIYDGKEAAEWKMPVNERLKSSQIFSAATLQGRYFALGTIQDGVIIIDKNGNLIQHINHKSGLQNNTILKVASDRSGNLWLGLDNGIDYINVNSPITFIQDPDGFGAGYAEIIFNDRLYLGTNQGLYVRDWNNGKSTDDFTMIPGTYGQVWSLGVYNGVLLCGHNYGTYIIDGKKARLISNIQGGWKYHILKRSPDYLIGGTYDGLVLFKWEKGTWSFRRRIAGFNESFRVFEEDENGDLWMSHGFKGIYRVTLNQTLDTVVKSRYYSSNDGLPSNYYLNVYKIKNKIVFTSKTGIYEYDARNDNFTYSVYFNQLLSPLRNISFLKEDPKGNIWYVSNNNAGVFRLQEDYKFQHIASSFSLIADRFLNGFESIYPYSDDQTFFGIENGFAHYSAKEALPGYPEFSAYVTKVTDVNLDSTIYYGNRNSGIAGKRVQYTIPFKNNNILFSYAAPVFDNPGNIEYSYKLSGYSEAWSKWRPDFTQEFSHLPDGKYNFTIKARNQLGIESFSDSLEFIVLPPWYKSVLAYFCYALIMLTGILLLRWIVNKRVEISNRKERLKQLREYSEKEREYIRQALQAEKEIMTMKNEKLRLDMIRQDKELANQAINIVRKNEFLSKIKEELVNLKKISPEEHTGEKIISIINRINKEVGHDKQREVFEKAFDEVHETFINKLKSIYPSLTPTELRLCAFLKMNIPTKEIAPLMNISVRGVEICRYRVRKKLGIHRATNLTTLLLNL